MPEETKEKGGRLSTRIRKMVDKDTEEFTDDATNIKATIDGAIKVATGVADLSELYDSVKDRQISDSTVGVTNICSLDPLGAREIIKKGHLSAIRNANADDSILTKDRKIGLWMSKELNMLAALSCIDSTEGSTLM